MPDDPNVAPGGITTEVVAPVEPQTNWLLSESADLQNDQILNQFKTREDALRAVGEMKRYADARVKIPDETSTPEDTEKFYNRLGRPENPDGYEITKPETIPVDEDAIKRFKTKAFEIGLTKKQTEAIASDYFANIGETQKKILADYEAGVNQQLEVLRGRWGDDFEKNKAQAINAFNHFAPDTLKATVEREGWGNNPDFVELFHRIGVATAEDVLRSPGTRTYGSLDDSIKAVDRELHELASTGISQNDPKYKDVLEKRNRLYSERYPESQL